MIDIHSHILWGVDDGPMKLDESIRMVCEAEEAGIKVLIATPHYKENTGSVDRIKEKFQELQFKTSDSEISLIQGYEVQYDPFILKLFDDLSELSLGNSRYMLLEFPSEDLPLYFHDTLYMLQLKGIIPIIAHPERNFALMKDIRLLFDLKQSGCLLQVDAASTIGIYGEKVRNFAKLLLTSNLISFIASDAHNVCGYSDWYLKAYRNVTGWVGEEKADRLYYTAARVILDSIKENINKTRPLRTGSIMQTVLDR